VARRVVSPPPLSFGAEERVGPGDLVLGSWDLRERAVLLELRRWSVHLPLVGFVSLHDEASDLEDDPLLGRTVAPGWWAPATPHGFPALLHDVARGVSLLHGIGPHHLRVRPEDLSVTARHALALLFGARDVGPTAAEAARRLEVHPDSVRRAVARSGRPWHLVRRLRGVGLLTMRLLWHEATLSGASEAVGLDARQARRWMEQAGVAWREIAELRRPEQAQQVLRGAWTGQDRSPLSCFDP